MSGPRYAAVDLGKTNCRIRLDGDRGSDAIDARGHGFPGFASEGGVELALAAIVPLLEGLGRERLSRVEAIGIGAAGADFDPAAARECALRLGEAWGSEIAMASDVITAHLGAFGGRAGTVLIAGTGSVAYRIDEDGSSARSDGWGPQLGDEGSGRWIGQTGLVRALRAADGRGPATVLEREAATLTADLAELPRLVATRSDSARVLASFAPVVLRSAADGDPVAESVVERAIEHLADTVCAVAAPGSDVSVIGGLAEDAAFLERLYDRLEGRGVTPRHPAGTALDGAAALAVRRDLPHERYVIRV